MTKQIPLTRGKFALVDDADFDWLNQWKWHLSSAGYAQRKAAKPGGGREHIYMHRLITGAGEGAFIDHVNRDTLDNRRANLRLATPEQNAHNIAPIRGKRSVFKGVLVNKNRWCAKIKVNGKTIYLGSYLTQREAAQAYNDAAIKYQGEYAFLNDLSVLPVDQDPPLQPKRLKRPHRTSGRGDSPDRSTTML